MQYINNYCYLSVRSLFFIYMSRVLKRYFFLCFPCSLKVPGLGKIASGSASNLYFACVVSLIQKVWRSPSVKYEFSTPSVFPLLRPEQSQTQREKNKRMVAAIKQEFWKICACMCILGRREEETSFGLVLKSQEQHSSYCLFRYQVPVVHSQSLCSACFTVTWMLERLKSSPGPSLRRIQSLSGKGAKEQAL